MSKRTRNRYECKTAARNASDAIGGAYSSKQLTKMDERFRKAVERAIKNGDESPQAASASRHEKRAAP